MPYAQLNRHQVYYQVHGHGPPVVLLHHATASSRNWRRQVAAWAVDFQVVTYDRPGFGRSEWLESWPEDYHYRDVDDLVALLEHLGINRVSLVGHSDGATIALLAAALHPEVVGCVVAEAPHVSVDHNTSSAGIMQFLNEVEKSAGLRDSLVRDHGPRGLQVVHRWSNRWLDPAFRNWDVSGHLTQVRCPVLVVHGAEDPFFPVAHSERIADQVVDGRIWLLLGVGHVPHMEQPDLYSRRIASFISEHVAG